MTIQECYEAIGGNYEDVLRRLRSEALIRKFTLKFLEDQSYSLLKQALGDNNYEEAFRGAHTLKGVCQNLSFDIGHLHRSDLPRVSGYASLSFSFCASYSTRSLL